MYIGFPIGTLSFLDGYGYEIEIWTKQWKIQVLVEPNNYLPLFKYIQEQRVWFISRLWFILSFWRHFVFACVVMPLKLLTIEVLLVILHVDIRIRFHWSIPFETLPLLVHDTDSGSESAFGNSLYLFCSIFFKDYTLISI